MKNGKNINIFRKKEKSPYEKIKLFFINLISVVVVGTFIFSYLKSNYSINRSNSIPTGIYKLYPLENIKKGDIVTFTVSEDLKNFMLERSYIRKSTVGFIKIVAGTEGDTIEINDNLLINGKIIKENLSKVDSLGRKLPLKTGKYTLKKDEYFMLGKHKRSFDSSYMGVIKKDQMKNKAELIYAFEESL